MHFYVVFLFFVLCFMLVVCKQNSTDKNEEVAGGRGRFRRSATKQLFRFRVWLLSVSGLRCGNFTVHLLLCATMMFSYSHVFFSLVFYYSSMSAIDAQDFVIDDAFNEIEDYNGVKTKNTFDLEDNNKPHDDHPEEKYLVCPELSIKRNYFTIPCDTTKDCSIGGPDLLCCESRCVKGIYASTPEPSHAPLFGFVERVCPVEPIAELFPIKECKTDSECSPRICCPEKQTSLSYCRTGVPKLDKLPGAKQFIQPLKNFISYMQCTPPPPPFLDLFPKPCKTQFDCFPNLCCQENGKRFCRPPKRSILALLASVTQRFGQAEATRKFISRITV